MDTNLIKAILNIIDSPISHIIQIHNGKNRINSQGIGLEEFIIDLFCGTLNESASSEEFRKKKRTELFSYIGNQSNPPDAIILGGDAIEIKKIEKINAAIALNSSFPKAKLFSDDPMLTQKCKNCEEWTEKDMIYAIGHIEQAKEKNILKSLCFVYGTDYAASQETYTKIKQIIKQGILTIDGVQFSETKELGRVNKVDPLGISNLRIRGMWHIDNPLKVFNDIYKPINDASFNLMALINTDKYLTFRDEDRKKIELKAKEIPNLLIKDVKIKNPDNPDNEDMRRDAKLITFTI